MIGKILFCPPVFQLQDPAIAMKKMSLFGTSIHTPICPLSPRASAFCIGDDRILCTRIVAPAPAVVPTAIATRAASVDPR